jgi:hypothetical protein
MDERVCVPTVTAAVACGQPYLMEALVRPNNVVYDSIPNRLLLCWNWGLVQIAPFAVPVLHWPGGLNPHRRRSGWSLGLRGLFQGKPNLKYVELR